MENPVQWEIGLQPISPPHAMVGLQRAHRTGKSQSVTSSHEHRLGCDDLAGTILEGKAGKHKSQRRQTRARTALEISGLLAQLFLISSFSPLGMNLPQILPCQAACLRLDHTWWKSSHQVCPYGFSGGTVVEFPSPNGGNSCPDSSSDKARQMSRRTAGRTG